MKKRFKSMLALMLCAALLCCAVPVASAANESEIVQELPDFSQVYESATTVVSQSAKQGIYDAGDNVYGFETLSDLMYLADIQLSGHPSLVYIGEDPLTIWYDLTFYYDVTLIFLETEVTIPSGVDVTFYGYESILAAEDINIRGAVSCPIFELYGDMDVDGYLNVRDSFIITENGVIEGKDNIVIKDGEGVFLYYYEPGIFQLDDSLALANKSDDPRDVYYIQCENTTNASLSGDYIIPENCIVELYSTGSRYCVIGSSNTLRVDGELYLLGGMEVDGTIENNGFIGVYPDENGFLRMNGDKYSGDGILYIQSTTDDLTEALPNVNLDHLEINRYREGELYYWELYHLGDLTKLGTPTDLQWGYHAELVKDEATGEKYTELVEGIPGEASWKNAEPTQDIVRVAYYQILDTEDKEIGSLEWLMMEDADYVTAADYVYFSDTAFTLLDPETGDYYFTVTNLGDYETYANSDVAMSDVWHYEKPTSKLGNCTNLKVEGSKATWTGPSNAESYAIVWYYAPTEDAEWEFVCQDWGFAETESSLPYDYIQECGAGYYYASVRAISTDIEQICSGDWTDWSEGEYISRMEPTIEEQLEQILKDDYLFSSEKITAVQKLDTEELKKAITKNPDVVELLAELEKQADRNVVVEVTDKIDFFDEDLVSIMGAGLNTPQNAAEDIKLVIDAPAATPVIPEEYAEATAVSFSMNLENVKNPQKLEVPVEIVLPIPEDMRQGYIQILHYDADGGYTAISPKTYTKDGNQFAKFVLTGFSDFVMLSGEGIKGDLDGNGSVDDEDVIYLLWHTLMSDEYPVNQPVDFDHNGSVDDEDVIYLLWHTLMSDEYPL